MAGTRPGMTVVTQYVQSAVITGLVPVISLRKARPCSKNRDGQDKPGHDEGQPIHLIDVRLSGTCSARLPAPDVTSARRRHLGRPRPASPNTRRRFRL